MFNHDNELQGKGFKTINRKILFNDGWEFAKSGLETKDPANLQYEKVDIPHDWLIYNTLNLYENSIGWYRKRFNYNRESIGEEVSLYFEGVYMDSFLYINGQFVGEWKYGYSSFEHYITTFLKEGENEILLKVVYQSPNSRWYSGAGIYRNVWLNRRSRNYILTDGIYVSTADKGTGWQVEIDTEMNLQEEVELTHQIIYKDQLLVSGSDRVIPDPAVSIQVNQQRLFVENPLLWSPEEPVLYQLKTQLKTVPKDGNGDIEIIETIVQNIGFRIVELDPQEGFILNGKRMKLNGVCEHHDLGALGAAFNKNALKRRFQILKEMGVNALRTAHNMPAVEFMDLADEMGFLVVSEAFDMWERPKTTYDYARFFKDWYKKDVKSWVRRDRNHPSLIMWSIGNEVYDTHANERGLELTRMLKEEVEKHDPKGNGKITFGSNYLGWENTQKCADILKVVGYNYGEKLYQDHHQIYPDWVIYGSETGSVVQSRGVYHFPYEQSVLADDDEQCSSLGNSSTSWGAKSTEACIISDRDVPFSLGQFIWTGFDYIGEPTPYHTKNSYFGQVDTATFKKDSYYIYQAAWTDYRENPMVHIFPYWDFNPGQIIDILVCSNAPVVELQVNGRTIGTYNIDQKKGEKLVGWWKVPYEEGEIKAIAYDEKGNIIATASRRSFGDPAKICLKADKTKLLADGRDLIFVEISMEDKEGNPVENASNRVHIEVEGAGRLVGLDNGDSTDFDQYKGKSRRLFSGKLMAIIAATLEPGEIKLRVSSKGLEDAEAVFESLPVKDRNFIEGITAIIENQDMPIVMGREEEIPVRKIELITEDGQTFTENKKEIYVQARIFPENCSYRDLEWKIVNDAGIELNIAQIEKLESGGEGFDHRVKITALADGEFRLRVMSRNGTEKVKLISELEFKATGLGTLYKDPYVFISAGLYDYSKGELTNGNEKGVATARDGETQVGFYNIDFGPYGSDTITIPIFALSSEKYPFQIWQGIPGEEGSELLAELIYQKESRWNVYQPETYRLPRRLKGITTITFVFNQKVHIKGFSFERKNRAFEKNLATECDHIYGDSYTLKDDRVEGIGNNVSLVFEEMDFTEKGATKISIYGRSPIDKNTIHIRFSGEEGESTQIVEFSQTDGYEEREFVIEKVTGKQKVTFVFLPGSNFDFGWFVFKN